MQKTAIITGASSGIGAATAEQFLVRGYSVINIARRRSPVEGVINIAADLGTDDGAAAAVQACKSNLPAESTEIALIHNASLMLKDTAQSCETEAMMRVLAVNVVAVNSLNRLLLPLMASGSSVMFV